MKNTRWQQIFLENFNISNIGIPIPQYLFQILLSEIPIHLLKHARNLELQTDDNHHTFDLQQYIQL